MLIVVTPVLVPFIASFSLSNVFNHVTDCALARTISHAHPVGTSHIQSHLRNFVISFGAFGVNQCFVVDTSFVVLSASVISSSTTAHQEGFQLAFPCSSVVVAP